MLGGGAAYDQGTEGGEPRMTSSDNASNNGEGGTGKSGKAGVAGTWTLARLAVFLEHLSTNTLVFVTGLIFAIDLFVPDALPFVDEVVLGVLTILLARWRSRKLQAEEEAAAKPPPKNVTPPAG
jgi:Na+/H+-dicarboxylate symporter